MEESRAAVMLLTMIGKSTEITARLTAKSMKALVKMAALLSALWQKASLGGKIKLAKLLESGAPLSAITMNRENYQRLKNMAKEIGINYYAAHRKDIDSYLVTLKTDDLQRVRTAFDFYNIQPTEKIENVHKDEDAMYKMDERDAREAADLQREAERNAAARKTQDEVRFEARKQQVVKENGCIDFEAWVRTNGTEKEIPHNLNLCLKADDAVMTELKKDQKAKKLNEAKAVKNLKQKKINEIGSKQPKIQHKELNPKL